MSMTPTMGVGVGGISPDSEGPSPTAAPNKPGMFNSAITGLGGAVKDFFQNRDKVIRSKTDKPAPRDIQPHYLFDEAVDKRLLGLADYYYREGSFEKIQFARKWMRNALVFQGYHELEWSEINVAWDIIMQDSGDYAFPNNYYRTLILHGIRAYIQNEPLIEPIPSNDDAEAQAATKAAKTALEIIKRTVKYDHLRVLEALNLRIFGNSFRYNYYSKDPRYGYVTQSVYQDNSLLLSPGGSICPMCGPMEGTFDTCPACGSPIADHIAPVASQVPTQVGTTRYPKGELVTEVVNPLEVYLRSSAYDIWHAPFLIRNRVVDRLALQSAFPTISLAPKGDEGGGEAYSTGGDLGLIYLQSLADLPGDPTQYAAWYERATAAAKALLIEAWLRPSTYFFDKELIKQFPDGLYIAKTGDTLLEARAGSIDDSWTHYIFNPVPGRIWGDGDDDIIPEQLKLDETDRLIMRNQGYNSVPMLVIDSQRIDKNEWINDPSNIVEAKSNGKPIGEAFDVVQSQPLSQETWQWRAAHLQDMYVHSRVAPSAAGQHEPGVNTFGGQESMAAKSDNSLLPNLLLWKTSDELWARQVLKIAAANWLDDRVHAIYGLDGKWEYEKLKGSALHLDKIHIVTRVLPIDPTQQDAMSQAVASGALDPQDPRVKRKMMELFHLPIELDNLYMDQKAQWREIEQGRSTGVLPMPMMIRDNDPVHIDICRKYLNSDDAQENPMLAQAVLKHAQQHMINMMRQQQMMGVIQGAGQGAAMAANPQAQPPGPGGQGGPGGPQGKQPGSKPGQGQQHGGQVPKNPVTRQQRAVKGQAARPPGQPSSGNQYHRKPLT